MLEVGLADDKQKQQQRQNILMRSLHVCEQQLSQNAFSEPLDPAQLRRLTNIERLISDLGDINSSQSQELSDDAIDRIAALEKAARPWIQRKNEILVSLSSDHTSLETNVFDQACEKSQEENQSMQKEAASVKVTEPDRKRPSTSPTSGMPLSMPPAHVRRSSIVEKRAELLGDSEGLRRRINAVPDSVEGVERLLKSQRETQDDLSSDLAKMAGILKTNSLAFSDLIEKDKALVQETTDMLDKNTANLGKHSGRLTKYRKRAWGTTGMTWLAVLIVVSVFFMLVLFMRIAPGKNEHPSS